MRTTLTTRTLTTVLALGFVLSTVSGARADGNGKGPQGKISQKMVVPGTSQYVVQGGYFSYRLGAQFVLQQVQIANFPAVMAARITSEPSPGSPLADLGLTIGDIVTRLDGIPITNKTELENHIYETNVRFVKAGTSWVQQGYIQINPNQYFQDTHFPPIDNGPSFPGNGDVLTP